MNLQEQNFAKADAAVAGSVAVGKPIPGTSLKYEAEDIANLGSSVMTSKAATNDLNNITSQHSTIVNDINNQATTVANNKAVADSQAKAQAEKDAAAKAVNDKLAIDKQNADSKAAALNAINVGDKQTLTEKSRTPYGADKSRVLIEYTDGTRKIAPKDTPIAGDTAQSTLDSVQSELDKNKALQEKELNDYSAAAQSVSDTIKSIQNGTIPLNAGEQAQVLGLQQSFQQLIDQTKLDNISAAGLGNIRGYQKGAAEYDPTFQVNTIRTIITKGVNNVADLNIKMASAVASLTQSFKDDNIKGIKAAWDVYNTASEKRQTAIQKTITDAQSQIKTAQDIKLADDKAKIVAKAKIQEDIDIIIKEADINDAPTEVIDAIRNATTVREAISAAKGYTGDRLEKQLKQAQIEKLQAEAIKTASEAEAGSPVAKAAAARSETLGLLSLTDSILVSPQLDQVVGAKNPFTYWTPGTNEQLVKNQLSQLKGNLSLENRQKLKGSGAVSDFEFRVLAQASSALDKNLSFEDTKKELTKVRGVMATAAGLPAMVQITDPVTKAATAIEATREGIDQAIIDGMLVEYI